MSSNVVCTLKVENNTCPYYSSEGNTCTAEESSCSFRGADASVVIRSKEYKREPRWYEQYYRK